LAIVPFRDRDKFDIFKIVSRATVISSSLGMEVNQFRQGVSVRDFSDYRQSLSPIIMGGDFPTETSARFSHQIPRNTYGQPKLFEDPGSPSPWGEPAPFIDIKGKVVAEDFIKDAGAVQYPVVLSTAFLLDPGQMDGVIEPLAIRESISNASQESPFIAHSVKATLLGMAAENVNRDSEIISQRIEFKPVTMSAFFESAEGSHGPRLPGIATGSIPTPTASDGAFAYLFQPGIVSAHRSNIVPFDDAFDQSPRMGFTTIGSDASLVMQALSGSFRDRGPFGVRFKSAGTGFIFRETAVTGSETGCLTVLGTDSLAFAGLKR